MLQVPKLHKTYAQQLMAIHTYQRLAMMKTSGLLKTVM